MTPDVHSSQAFFPTATQRLHDLEQRWHAQAERVPNPAMITSMVQELESLIPGVEALGYEQPVRIARQLQSLLTQIRDQKVTLDGALRTPISEGIGTLVVMVQALSVSEGPALSVLERLSEGILPALDQAEAHLQACVTRPAPAVVPPGAPPLPAVAAQPQSKSPPSDPQPQSDLPSEPEGASIPAQSSHLCQSAADHREMLLGIAGIFWVALMMRMWNLGQFDAPVFDEVYFPVFAENYLDGESFYDVHPPLGKYIIALGIQLLGRGEWGYRIMPAFMGALIPVLVAGVAYRLTYWRNYALLAGALMLTDGLFLVESRYGLMNVFLVAFGFAAQIFMLTGLVHKGANKAVLFMCSGVMLGAAIAVKFNGLFFSLLFIALMILAWGVKWLWPQHLSHLGVLARIVEVRWWHYLFCFILPAFVFYAIAWIPHLILMPQTGAQLPESSLWIPTWVPELFHPVLEFCRPLLEFLRAVVSINQSLINGHTGSNLVVTDDTPVHPYCSTSLWPLVRQLPILPNLLPQEFWGAGAWSWPVLGRPVGYYFNSEGNIWRAVHALGNPILWWLGIVAIVGLSLRGLRRLRGVPAYLLLGFAANYLPWFLISRCVFIYHYMSALAFVIMALAWVACWWLHDLRRWVRGVGVTVVTLVIAGLFFFAPVWFGLPLSSGEFYARMWFQPNPRSLFCFSPEQCRQTPIKFPVIPGLNWI